MYLSDLIPTIHFPRIYYLKQEKYIPALQQIKKITIYKISKYNPHPIE
jgi:hypothetical protein